MFESIFIGMFYMLIVWGIALFVSCIIEGAGLVLNPINFIMWMQVSMVFGMELMVHGLYQHPPPTFTEFALHMIKAIIYWNCH